MPMTRAEIATLVAASLPDNTSRQIEPAHLRAVVAALLEAAVLGAESPWSAPIAAGMAAVAANCATAAQGALAASAVQPDAMATAIASAIATGIEGIRPLAGVREATGTTYTLAAGDAEFLIECPGAGAVTITLPADAVASIPVGASIHVCGAGTGGLAFAAGAGATVSQPAAATLALAGQGSMATAIKAGANRWRLIGDLGAAE